MGAARESGTAARGRCVPPIVGAVVVGGGGASAGGGNSANRLPHSLLPPEGRTDPLASSDLRAKKVDPWDKHEGFDEKGV